MVSSFAGEAEKLRDELSEHDVPFTEADVAAIIVIGEEAVARNVPDLTADDPAITERVSQTFPHDTRQQRKDVVRCVAEQTEKVIARRNRRRSTAGSAGAHRRLTCELLYVRQAHSACERREGVQLESPPRQGGRRFDSRRHFRCAWRSPRSRFAPLLVAGWCAFLFLYGIDAGPLYRTESLRAIIGRECLHGHWLYPVLYGEPFLTKPPGHYAAIGLCSLPFGEVSAASARLPSVFAATLAVVLMHGMFRRVLGERAALLVALLLPCSVLWLDKVPSAEIDMTLVGWVTAALVLFSSRIRSPGDRTSAGLAGLARCCALRAAR